MNFTGKKVFKLIAARGNRLLVRKEFSSQNNLVDVSDNDGVRIITMNSSQTRNSLSMDMMNVLLEKIRSCNDPKLRCIVIKSTGSVFSSGHNLKELAGQTEEYYKQVFLKCAELMQTIIEAPLPVIAGVNGKAVAAGCQLVATCDIVVATRNSLFATPGADFGLFCSTPGIAVSRTVNRKTALKMLLTGLPLTADEALASGLVSTVCDESELDKEIDKCVSAIKNKSRAVIQLGKIFYYKQVEMDLRSAYKLGAQVMANNLMMVDGQEGIRSFVEKRPPRWKHE